MTDRFAPMAIGLFCQDIRQEIGDTISLVGVLPSQLRLAGIPAIVPKLGLYIRVRTPLAQLPSRVRARLETPWGESPYQQELGADELHREADRIRRDDASAGFNLTMGSVLSVFELKAVGRLAILVEIDDLVLPAGSLQIALQ